MCVCNRPHLYTCKETSSLCICILRWEESYNIFNVHLVQLSNHVPWNPPGAKQGQVRASLPGKPRGWVELRLAPFTLSNSIFDPLLLLLLLLSRLHPLWLFVTLWTVACLVPLSMGFSKQEYWRGLPCPPPGHLPHPRLEPLSLTPPTLAGRFFTTSTTWEALTLIKCM